MLELAANVMVGVEPVLKVIRLAVDGVGVIPSAYSTLLHPLEAITVLTKVDPLPICWLNPLIV